MGVVLSIGNSSLEELLEAEKQLQSAIKDKKKEIALAKSGFLIKGSPIVDIEYFELVSDPADILFVNWYVKVKLKYKDHLPKFIHKCTHKDIPQTSYIFDVCANSMGMLSGSKTAVTIHEDTIPYLIDEYREWSWNVLR
ncbi:hypothetical protein BSK59_16025 [Paenibacillus odorifer]|uniref:hypothetical protein n=1 Tax=Paenibacillus odorifer TaxID=189426 RepID=UPI00096C0B9E|nr:hypothetical protein [Paenibacillus odorifer]OME54088.1 hypothetical protein BSK59_16025 [Paenibacillus odorifer]